ncbi:HAD family hydrolase [Oryzibacter oryziterrae]|uniref:HAD family hydrolase n=1 Tax=Oryzibacter oryziterrae TaxID=2766474 RepID=UPI001F227FB3|nr:HAD family hydrolase [Oryzibacter oryziterrae]
MNGLPVETRAGADGDIAVRHRPLLRLDDREPFRPLVFGWAVYHGPARSLSSKFEIRPQAAYVAEYAVWYDWDIQHLYDLEHVWVHAEADGTVVAVEASQHGQRLAMRRADGSLPLEGMRPLLVSEPGKHAHWPEPDALIAASRRIEGQCGRDGAGLEGVHLGNRFAEAGRFSASRFDARLARLFLKRRAFQPAFSFSDSSDRHAPRLVAWGELDAWIPARVTDLIAGLPTSVPHLAALFLDCGDTLVDEGSEVKFEDTEVVTAAELIPAARWCLDRLVLDGHRLALVADGPRATFENVLKPRGLWDHFSAHAISEDVGVHKPDPRIFARAITDLGLDCIDRGLIAMVGNNLARDIAGANRLGLISIFMGWSRRRSHQPADDWECPDHTIYALSDLPRLIEQIELNLQA